MRYFFEIYGCQMNIAEGAALKRICEERGWTEADGPEQADLVLLHTCSVRATAEQRVLGRLGQYGALKKKRRAGGGRFALVLSGCMAGRVGEDLKKRFSALDYLMGPGERQLFPRILEAEEGLLVPGGPAPDGPVLDAVPDGPAPGNSVSDCPAPDGFRSVEKPVFSFAPSHLEKGRFRSFVPVMHGCNNFCSYCIVPYVRGREVSRAPASILDEIRLLAAAGVREITLLGQSINSYCWRDGAVDFPGLLGLIACELEKLPGTIGWVRFLSSHPKDLAPGLAEVMAASPFFCRHIHLCVQHGSNRILAAMNRGYTREAYLDLVARLRCALPGLSLSTDILVGFPGETEEDVEATLDLMEQVQFLYAYMYHYNPREGTAAFGMKDRVGEEVKRGRLARVIALQKKHTASLLESRIGLTETVLIEGISRKNADELVGRTERDEMVVLPGSASLIGSFAAVKLSSLSGNTLRGMLL